MLVCIQVSVFLPLSFSVQYLSVPLFFFVWLFLLLFIIFSKGNLSYSLDQRSFLWPLSTPFSASSEAAL